VTGFRFVSSHEDLYPVEKLCDLMGVSRSGYYSWAGRGPSDRTVADAHLEDTIRQIHHRSRRTYGAPRIEGQLRMIGVCVGRKRVARLMREAHLVGAHSRKKWRRGKSDVAPAGDLLNRDFSATRPNERWVADVTEFATGEGKLFLAGVRDLYGRGLVGWAMSERQTADLVIDAMVMAVGRRNPTGPLLHHSDKGSTYTAMSFTQRLSDLGLFPSYGSTGDAYDNAAMETFWATLKREIAWIHGSIYFTTRAELRAVLFEYIEVFYNRERAQSGLGHKSPAAYEAAFTAA
jgi:transposase InsO family protein